ncbi:U3 small nucleolar ribonucleoprotein MPP10 [Colletotrichum truncatum]|uniref:U3 small nucleolar ribonucleoprotein MPP10 n=1 Tax=Colletotrichum truncatum TaxID=5467 RepID=A0ACC3ZER4_COLTU|nr:U3 small nucleolar ribonucleoprotein MPP10 [Colletotrichum truncatum]KAF6801528.1 U3 small nucleolar ribonucleoprotein MPP10 [Colletotrichum truncatum]
MAAGSTSSSLTSQTSNTLTFAPGMAAHLPNMSGASTAEVRALFDNLGPANRHAFLQPPPAIPSASLQVVKDTLDAFAGQISDEQLRLLKEATKKRKRADAGERADVLKIRKVHVDGFETTQVWQQARRIIQSALKHSQETLQELEDRNEIVTNGVAGEDSLAESDEEGSEDDDEEEGSDDEEELSGSDLEGLEDDDDEEDLEEGSDVEGLTGDLEDMEDDEEQEEEDDDDDVSETYVEDPNGLNDGFFSIDDFNKQTQWFEEQDARGDPNTDVASDEEEIDWTADPLAASSKSKPKKKADEMEEDVEEEEDDDEDDGPTFGDMDLNAPEGASDDEDMDDAAGEEEEFNANGIYFKDYFAPPPKKGSKDKKKKSVRFAPKKVTEEDVERAMEDVKRDLFDDESDHGDDSEDALSDVSAGDPRSRRSAHERRQAKLAEEIRKLEAESVAKRSWTLTGEASAVERPVNSLLEEDLAFEHLGKPVPVITAEVSEGIEDLIKRRIIAQDFDEVLRRRPGADLPENTRRGLIELDDSKSGKGLAEIYEEEHLKNTDPDGYVSKSDEKLQREEKEIEQMWKDLSARLDSLSSWHYKPKPAAPSLTVVSDAATISMEDAQPTTAQGVSGGQSMIAPQEVYKAGKDTAEKGEVVAKNGLPVAKQEMSREDKLRRRRREKERIRKAGGTDAKKPLGKKAQMQKDTLADLKKGGVKVINRKGEVVDVDGNKAKAEAKATSSSFKL